MSEKRSLPPYLLFPDFLDGETHAALLAHALANEAKFQSTVLYTGKHDPQRRVSVGTRDLGPVKSILKERVSAMVPDLIRRLRVSPFETRRIELELVAHGDGAFFKPHLDTRIGAQGDLTSIRHISAVYYFHAEPKAYSGGALRLFAFGAGETDFVDIVPQQNMLLVFPSWATHAVLDVQCPSKQFRDSRFAVNCWVHASR